MLSRMSKSKRTKKRASPPCPPVLSPTDGNDGVCLDVAADLKLAGFFMSSNSGRVRSWVLIGAAC